MMTAEEQREVEIKGPAGTGFRARGYDLVSIAVYMFMAGVLFILWHQTEKISKALGSVAESQREMACVIAQPQEDRPKEIYNADSFCKRLARYGFN